MPPAGWPRYGDPAAGRRWRLQKLLAWLSACVQVPADRPTDGFGDADVFLGGAEQQVAFEFRIKAYRFDRRCRRAHRRPAAASGTQDRFDVVAAFCLVSDHFDHLVGDRRAVGRPAGVVDIIAPRRRAGAPSGGPPRPVPYYET